MLHRPFFSSTLPPTAARSLIHPALNLLALILVLLSFYLTWQIHAPALRSASSDVRAHLMGATAALALVSARRLVLASDVYVHLTGATTELAVASARQSALALDIRAHLTGATAATALASARQLDATAASALALARRSTLASDVHTHSTGATVGLA